MQRGRSNRPTFALITFRSVIVMTVTPVAAGALRFALAPRPGLLSHQFQPSVRSHQDFCRSEVREHDAPDLLLP